MSGKKFVLLSEQDNVLVCCQNVQAGESISIEGIGIVLSCDIDVGHKIARVNIAKGDKIIKYMAPIGSATKDISIGDHVHMHNMQSDYISSHTRQSKMEQKKVSKVV